MLEGDGGRASAADPRERIPPLIPCLRTAARELVGAPAEADRLVIETLAEALARWDAVEPGAALETWLLLILGERAAARGRGKAP